MKLLLDQGLPRSTVAELARRGVDNVHVASVGLAAASDIAILAYALQNNLIVVTLDADFHAIQATSGASKPSVIRIRIEGLDGTQLADLLTQVVAASSVDLAAGAMVSVSPPNLMRIRALPIV
jgi:predicted nuclease of predicted toxin-antitoxin system